MRLEFSMWMTCGLNRSAKRIIKKGNAELALHKASGSNTAGNRPDHNLNYRMMPASKQQFAERGVMGGATCAFATVAAQAGMAAPGKVPMPSSLVGGKPRHPEIGRPN
jgi:hypothetical protein